ncbi:hypothetical protein GALMADRAFT_82379 [Galerina marginata CBS 339.88]|uniref:DNA-directed DNA polymerase n=1 Tax=Galerina marginata (strain CBS 339.88) TaxID=685588 RepID=A0A067SBA1_GALM3|nr:hypothetical protein GALMADRAFT_82379 [Galerina marginata CBS 339.88]
MDNTPLKTFFGFIECIIESPINIKIPILPMKHRGKTIFPTGTWKGTYFSEELKEAVKYGYKIKMLKGYEYSKYDLFKSYIEHFYNIKKISFGAQRFIAKMHLNQLYGYFGRKQELLETVNINKSELAFYANTRIIKTIIESNDNTLTLLLYSNLNVDILSEIKEIVSMKLNNNEYSFVKSNVGIAAAVTAYARIHMIPFKVNCDIYYSDTDSIFTSTKLDPKFLGLDIGLMKDELNGLLIEEAYFLGIKQYGYYYFDKNDNRIEKSVFSGITRDSLSFTEIESLFKGEILVKSTPNRFFKSLKYLHIKIKTVNTNIVKSSEKLLIENNYIPININTLNNRDGRLNKFLRKILKSLKYVVNLLKK